MSVPKNSVIFVLSLLFLSQNLLSQIILQGTVMDNGGEYLGSGAEPIVNALVTLIDQSDTNFVFSDYTNEQGQYSIEIIQTGVEENASPAPGNFRLHQNYPNPFNPSTVIGYEITHPCKIRINVYNVSGGKVRTLIDGHQMDSGRVIWDATDDRGRTVPAGLYICSMYAEGKRFNRKMLLVDGHCGSSPTENTFSDNLVNSGKSTLNKQISSLYTLKITGEDITPYEEMLEITGNMTSDVIVARTMTDIDRNSYRTVKIGYQWWMAENLKVIHYRNGDPIPNVTGDTEWYNLATGAYCAYDNNETRAESYGYLFNWYTVNDSRSIAPSSWHVPTDEEWQTLVDYLGGESVAGGKLKETGTTHWIDQNTGVTNESGFTARSGGCRCGDGSNINLGSHALFWSSTESDSDHAWYRGLFFDCSDIYRYYGSRRAGFSIRLVRDY
jgi:uncharacterized protein (TIGR02145 family)